MVGLRRRLMQIGLVGMVLLQGAAALAQEGLQGQEEQEREEEKKALKRSRSTVFGGGGMGFLSWGRGDSGFRTHAALAGLGATAEYPAARNVVVGGYVFGGYLGVEKADNSETSVLQKGGFMEVGPLMKIRFPLDDGVSWYFPFRGGIGGFFADSESEFLGAFHAGLIGVEALLDKHLGITFDMPFSILKTEGPPTFSSGIELGLLIIW